MRATVTKPFDGAKDGEIYPVSFKTGDTIEGDLAMVAVREGWAAEVKPDAKVPIGLADIPADWAELKATELVALAKKLGASTEVNTKVAASDFIAGEVSRRAEAAPAG